MDYTAGSCPANQHCESGVFPYMFTMWEKKHFAFSHRLPGPLSLDFYMVAKGWSPDCSLGPSLPWLMMKLTYHIVEVI